VRPGRYIEINNFYTATVYNKGAELVRMLQTMLGREGFRRGMDLYFERHDGQAATVEDFVACFADATGKDLQQFMTWYSQAGTPELVCQLKYDARAKTADLTIAQVLPPTPGEHKKKPLHIPVRLGLLGGNGQDLALTLASGQQLDDGLIEVRKRTETFRFRDVPSRPVPSLLRGFLGARQPDHRPCRCGPAVPDGQRQAISTIAGRRRRTMQRVSWWTR
jgi:aminopeptidase N